MEDEALVEQALAGDDQAFRTLHDRYFNQVFHFAHSQLGDYYQAEELTQDIFLKMARNLHKFKRKSKFKTWLFSIGHHAAIDYHRKNKRHKISTSVGEESYFDLHTNTQQSAEEEVLLKSLGEQIKHCLKELPHHYRSVLSLRFLQGFSIAETAEVMAKTPAAIKSLQRRAMDVFKDEIEKEVKQHEA